MMARSGSCRRLGAYNQMVNRLTVQSVDSLSLEKSSIRAFRFDATIFLLLTFEYCADFLGFGNIIVDIALGIVHHLRTPYLKTSYDYLMIIVNQICIHADVDIGRSHSRSPRSIVLTLIMILYAKFYSTTYAYILLIYHNPE